MRIKKHGCLLFLLAVAFSLAAAVYWWSGPLVYFLLQAAGSPSGRDALVQSCKVFPLLRRESLVEESVSLHWKRLSGDLNAIITSRYSKEVLMDELEDLWTRRLQAQEYHRAGVALAFARDMFGDTFRPRVRREDAEKLVAGLGENLEWFLRWHWNRGLAWKIRQAQEKEPPSSESITKALVADLLAYMQV